MVIVSEQFASHAKAQWIQCSANVCPQSRTVRGKRFAVVNPVRVLVLYRRYGARGDDFISSSPIFGDHAARARGGSLFFRVHRLHAQRRNIGSTIFGYPRFWARLLPVYLSGVLAYQFRDSIRLNRIGALLCLIGFFVAAKIPYGLIAAMPTCGTYVLMYLAFTDDWKWRSAARYGDFSYGIYLYAFPIQQSIMHIIGQKIEPFQLFLLATPPAVLAGIMSWYLVERWFQQKKPRTPEQRRLSSPQLWQIERRDTTCRVALLIWQRKAEGFVDEVDERLAGEVAAEVFAEEVGHVVGAGGGLAADVWGDDYVWLVPEAAFDRERLGFGDVDAGAADVAGFQRGDQIFGDD